MKIAALLILSFIGSVLGGLIGTALIVAYGGLYAACIALVGLAWGAALAYLALSER